MTSPSSPSVEKTNLLAAITKCVGFFVGGVFFAWNLLVIYAFSSMVDPALPASQRTSEIIRRFLFGDGIHQFFIVIGMLASVLICFALVGANVWSIVTGTSKKTNKLAVSTGAVALSLLVFATIYFVFS